MCEQTLLEVPGLSWLRGEICGMPGSFFLGLCTGMLLVLLIVLLVLCIRRRRRSRGIAVSGANGDLYVTSGAVREFVARVLDEFNEAGLCAVALRKRRDGYLMRIALQVSPDTEVIRLVEDIRRRIIRQAADKMGLDKPLKVNVVVRSFSQPDKKTPVNPPPRNFLTGFPNVVGSVPPEEGDF